MNRLTKYFLNGLLVFVPAALTIFAFLWIFTKLDTGLRTIFKISIPGLGIAVTIVVIFVVGFVASSFLGKKLFGLVESAFTKTPLVKMIYSSVKGPCRGFCR